MLLAIIEDHGATKAKSEDEKVMIYNNDSGHKH
jgi:hypothetical protein